MNETRGYFFGIELTLKEYPHRRLFVKKDSAIAWRLIEPDSTNWQFEKMKCSPGFAVGKQITITAFENPRDDIDLVVHAKLTSDSNKDSSH